MLGAVQMQPRNWISSARSSVIAGLVNLGFAGFVVVISARVNSSAADTARLKPMPLIRPPSHTFRPCFNPSQRRPNSGDIYLLRCMLFLGVRGVCQRRKGSTGSVGDLGVAETFVESLIRGEAR